ncbi:hypothetical protein CBL_03969 [Carabus blaptoides fortunei]
MANRHQHWRWRRDSAAITVPFLPAIRTPHPGRSTSTISSSMKWRTTKQQQQQQQPFLVLPLLEHERSVSAESQLMHRRRQRTPTEAKPLMMVSTTPTLRLTTNPSNRNVSASTTDTWPPKHSIGKSKKRSGISVIEIERPLTATLERPVLLNISLLDKLDMSRVRKEFLCITNLCRKPAVHNLFNNASDRKCIKTRSRRPETTSEDSVVDSDENTSVRSRARARKVSKMMNNTSPRKTVNNSNNNNVRQLHIAKQKQSNDANNNNTAQNRVVVEQCAVTDSIDSSSSSVSPIDVAFSGPKTARTLPEPCKTCGRPDQPERFHSHPATPLIRTATKRAGAVTPGGNTNKHMMKNSVQKPVAMKYKGTKQKAPAPPVPTTTPVPSVAPTVEQNTRPKSPQRGPRTVICYICGREFGTASLPLHEPKCLQKWERENSQLPRHLQRKVPVKPEQAMTPEQWNKFAWEASQAALARCENCGRTFLPDRLIVHKRSCKPGTAQRVNFPTSRVADMTLAESSTTTSPAVAAAAVVSSGVPPVRVECSVCGRMFGTKSIGIHEPQCLKKWQVQNNQPAGVHPATVKKNNEATVNVPATTTTATRAPVPAGGSRPPSGPKKPMLPCYICGREYGTSSIYIHEPQCLKRWRHENDQLPVHQRRKEPQRPDIKFTPSGQIDYEATNEVKWKSHLSQLVPCQMCGRTFNPDRVIVHERSCKGEPNKILQ